MVSTVGLGFEPRPPVRGPCPLPLDYGFLPKDVIGIFYLLLFDLQKHTK